MIGASPIDGSSTSISARLRHQSAANRQHLLLAAAQHGGARPQPFAQARKQVDDIVEQALRLALALGPRQPPCAEQQIFLNGERWPDVATFRHVRDAECCACVFRHAVERLSVKHDAAAIDSAGAGDRAQQRGLARAVRAEHADRLAGATGECYVVQHAHVPVAGVEMFSMASMIPLRTEIGLDHAAACAVTSCGRAVGDQHAIVDHHHPLDHFGDGADGVVDQDDGDARGLLAAQNIDELVYLDAVEARERLVEQQKGRSRDEGAGDFEQPYL